jgi:uncharacterized membrane protein (DUF2068 family)
VLALVAIGAFSLVNKDLRQMAERLLEWADLDRESEAVQAILERLPGLTPGRLEAIGGGAIAYAALYFVEAYGLFRARVWGEWLTIFATASFIPLEVIECFRSFHAWKLCALGLNVAIVGYLVVRRTRASRP